MTENKRFYLLNYKNNPIYDSLENKEYNARYKKQREELCKLLNELSEENEQLKSKHYWYKQYKELLNENEQLKQENKKLEKQIHLIHMSSMFSTVKSFKGDVSKRYEYSEETDTIYDTANTYGQYNKILDKKEVVMLLNEYETLLKGDFGHDK